MIQKVNSINVQFKGQIKNPQKMSLEALKKAGYEFNNGKVVAVKKYTGSLYHSFDDGSKLSMDYVDGVLKKSAKIRNNSDIIEKSYVYDGRNDLIKVETKKNNELVSSFNKETDEKKGLITRTNKTPQKEFRSVQDKNTGKMVEVDGTKFFYTNGKSVLERKIDKNGIETTYYPWGNKKTVKTEDSITFYDESGKYISETELV